MTPQKSITRLMVVAAFILIAAISYQSRDQISTMISTTNWRQLALAISALTLANIGMAIVFTELLSSKSPKYPPKRIITGSFLLSQVAKYIPGRIWGIAMQATMLRAPGATSSIFAINIELTIINLAMATGIGMAFLIWPQYGLLYSLTVLLATWLIGTRLLSLDFFRRAISIMQRMLPLTGRKLTEKFVTGDAKPTETRPSGYSGLLLYILMYCLGWWLLAKATTQLDATTCMNIVAALSLSYIAGVASLLPAGIGAREGTLVILAPALGLTHENMAAIAITSRAAMILMDILTAAIGAALLKTPAEESA